MLYSGMVLLDFPGLEFAGPGDQDGCAYVLSSCSLGDIESA